MRLKKYIRRIPEFKGVVFLDITPLLKNRDAFYDCVDRLVYHFEHKDVDVVASPEARGFILGGAIAYKLGVGFVPIRKPGKLPAETVSVNYKKEYEEDVVEMHLDAIDKGQRVLFIDDLLATGGSALASIKLIEKVGGEVVGLGFLIELEYLNGRSNEELSKYDIYSLIKYKDVNDL